MKPSSSLEKGAPSQTATQTASDEGFRKLHDLLQALFRFDSADLDFGIYRIMNQRRDEIARFLDEQLLLQVKESFVEFRAADKAALEKRLNEAIQQARELGVDPEATDKVKALRVKMAGGAVDLPALENEVFSDLYTFFGRYYKEGDFLMQRRYKDNVYSVPYEGEDVKLYWATREHYYVKTSDYFQSYAFLLPSGRHVKFDLVSAGTETATVGLEKRFILHQNSPTDLQDGELVIRFEFVPDPEKRKQEELNSLAVKRILERKELGEWVQELATKAPSEKNPERSLLEKHLSIYTARNTFDYFIHRDLANFLRRELDFYIKNEVIHLDDIEHQSAEAVDHYLSKVRALRKLASKIIDFLAQLENFQKRLWLKRKFVVETNYCLTVDRIPKVFYPKIAANKGQLEEWAKLFGVSKTLNANSLEKNPYLVVDTRFFDEDFKDRLLAALPNLDEQIGGLIIHGDSFQALRLLERKYQRKIDCVYIDPPYNSKTTEILYKNNYKHSSWLSLMSNKISACRTLLTEDASFIVAIDENEQERLGLLLDEMFPRQEKVCVSIVHNPRGIQGENFAYCHDYAYFIFPSGGRYISSRPIPKEEWDYANLRKWGGESTREYGRNEFYPIYVKEFKIVRTGEPAADDFHPQAQSKKLKSGELEIWPIDEEGIERKWRYSKTSLERLLSFTKVVESGGRTEIKIARTEERFKTVWNDPRYDAGTWGTRLLTDILGAEVAARFSFPKSLHTVKDCVYATTAEKKDATVLDFLAGSGTTAHAVLELNQEDGGSRKYILVEMGEYFDSVLLTRIKKVVYSRDWKDAKPLSREGQSHILKYVRLESYEDALDNLELNRSTHQENLLQEHSTLREEYLLNYMLDVESRGSRSVLRTQAFEDPFNYKLKCTSGGETLARTVDLVETFNYLLGLRINSVANVDGIRVVLGNDPEHQKVLVLWRNVKEKDSDALDEWFRKQHTILGIQDLDLVYVNQDNTLENLRSSQERWQVRLTEDAFHRLMFDVEDV
jgi:adenine-specific DNA-methyltransferase